MKIAIFSDAFFPQINGVVVYTIELANYLSQKGHKVYLIVPNCKDRDIKLKLNSNIELVKIAGIRMKFYPDFKFTNLISTKLLKIFAKNKIDIINFQTPFTTAINALGIAKLKRIPIVGTFHTFIADPDYLKHLPLWMQKLVRPRIAWEYLKLFYNPCDLIISPSKHTKEELLKNKIKDKIDVVNIGINFNEYENNEFNSYEEKFKNLKVKSNSFVYVGRIANEKNIEKLIRGFNLLLRNNNDCYLYLVGDGPQFKEVKNLIKYFSLEKNVFLLGRIENMVIRKTNFLSKFKAFVTMSNTENQPVTLIEAMAKGLPLIGANSKGITEMINGNGYLVEPDNIEDFADKMLELILDDKKREKFSKKSLINSKQYSGEKNFKLIEEKFLKLIR
jgi:1,2-diacylglycerol 3-alpha-glucosyltransferase